MIEMVFAMLMIQNGNTIEYVPTLGMTDCLQQKRVVSRQIGDEQEGIYLQCQQLKAELYEDCGGDTCRLKIKKIQED